MAQYGPLRLWNECSSSEVTKCDPPFHATELLLQVMGSSDRTAVAPKEALTPESHGGQGLGGTGQVRGGMGVAQGRCVSRLGRGSINILVASLWYQCGIRGLS